MSFANVYYKRATATEKSCYVCYKPTSVVLATLNTTDFLYVCGSHLTDVGFATRINNETDSSSKPEVSKDEVEKVKREWEERERRKKEKQKDEDKKAAADDKDQPESSVTPLSAAKSPTPTPSPTPTHLQYALHRDYFAMRLAEHRKRKQTAAAKALAARLPPSLRGTVEDKF